MRIKNYIKQRLNCYQENKSFLEYNNISLKYIWRTLLLGIIYVVLHKPINQFLIHDKIELLSKHILKDDSLQISLFYIFLISIFILAFYRIFIGYIASVKRLWVCLVITLIYLFLYRDQNDDLFTITSVGNSSFFKYLDLFPYYTLANFCIFIINQLNYKKKNEQNIISFYEDFHGTFNESDLFNREAITQSLYNYILNTENQKAFAIGVIGDWGNGKSVFLNQLKKQLTSNDWIVMEFNPWRNENSNAIVKDFFTQLIEKLKIYNEDIASQVSSYFNDLLNLQSSTVKQWTDFTLNFLNENKSLAAQYNNINASIKKLDKKLVIYIDDVDRLDEKEVLEVLKIVRNTAGFGNTFFVLAYDRDYINNHIKNKNESNYGAYLEKIIQFEIELPPLDAHIIKRELLILLSKKLSTYEYSILKRVINNDKIDFNNYICNLRDVVRFTNAFVFNYNYINSIEDIILEEFFLIELLKYKHITDYKILYKNFNFFSVYPNVSNQTFLKVPELGSSSLENETIMLNEIYKLSLKHKMVNLLFADPNLKDSNFSNYSYKSISNRKNFYKYFTNQVFKNDISFRKIELILNNGDIKNILNECVFNDDPTNVARRIYEYVTVNKICDLKVYEIFIYLIDQYFDKSTDTLTFMLRYFTQNKLVLKTEVDSVRDLFSDKFYTNDKYQVLIEILEKISNTTFNENYGIKEELSEYLIEFLNKSDKHHILLSKYDISRINGIIRNLNRTKENNGEIKLSEKSIDVKNYLLKYHTKHFLETTIGNEAEANIYSLNYFFQLFFNNPKDAIAELNKLSNNYIDEYIKMLEIAQLFSNPRWSGFVFNFAALEINEELKISDNYKELAQIILEYNMEKFPLYKEILRSQAISKYGKKLSYNENDDSSNSYLIITTEYGDIDINNLINDINTAIKETIGDDTSLYNIITVENNKLIVKVFDEIVFRYISIQPSNGLIFNNYYTIE